MGIFQYSPISYVPMVLAPFFSENVETPNIKKPVSETLLIAIILRILTVAISI